MNKRPQFDNTEELEIRFAFLEDTLAKLSDEFYLQQRELDDLKTKYTALVHKLLSNDSSDAADSTSADERPPHY